MKKQLPALLAAAAGKVGLIAPVGTLVTGSAGTTTTTLAVSPTKVGNILVLAFREYPSTASVTSISGGGVTTWHKLASGLNSGSSEAELWYGVVTTAGAATVTALIALSTSSILAAQEFAKSGGTWAQDGSGGTANGTGTTATCPSLTPAGNNELYVGLFSSDGNYLSTGSTAGYTYQDATAGYAWFAYNAKVSHSGGAQAPAAPQASHPWLTVGALMEAL